MPTQFPTSRAEPHRQRRMAESFGSDAERYDRVRPRYPDALIERIAAPDVLDVGCGTGIDARQLQAAGSRVLGVDVDARMAAFARARGLEVEVAKFEDWDPAGRTFDAVVAGQTWHWIEPVAGATKAASVLRPGGRLTAFWNVMAPPPDLAAAFSAVYRRALPDWDPWAHGPLDAYTAILDRTADGMRAAGFGEPERWRYEWERSYTREEWLDAVRTGGDVARMTPDQLEALLAGLGEALGESFTMPYAAVAISAITRET
jgi:SAM-dependent methyltransferase